MNLSDNNLDMAKLRVPKAFVERIPLRYARDNAVVAASPNGDAEMVVVLGKPDRLSAADRVRYKLDRNLPVVMAEERQVQDLIDRAYHEDAPEVAQLTEELEEGGMPEVASAVEDMLEGADKAQAVKLTYATVQQAIRQRASDIHLEPGEGGARLRFRIDGVLYDRASLNRELHEAVVSRIKVMGRMDIAEHRLPQDGGVTVSVGERRIDLRIATLPTQYGERVVIRLLDKTTGLLSLDGLGLDEKEDRVRRILDLHHGIVLVCGPTGSGKTTTLYAMLSALNSSELNILTLEDPIEYQLPGIAQSQVSTKKGLTFAKGLRALVRQDPDIIMVGEVRDLETATIAIQSSLTGHLVFSTLHTNDAPSSITRLLDLGVEPYLVASSVNAVLSQRLVRKICPDCREEVALNERETLRLGWSKEDLAVLSDRGCKGTVSGKGCASCFNTGFVGRTAIFELLLMTDSIRELIVRRASAGEIKKAALAAGFSTLRRDGLSRVAAGVTTLEEVRRTTHLEVE